MIDVVTVSSRGQLVIPEKIRSQLRIASGTRLVVFEENGAIILRPEEAVEKRLKNSDKQESLAWLALAEQSLKSVWDNDVDSVWDTI